MKLSGLGLVTAVVCGFAQSAFATPTCAEISDSTDGFYSYFQEVSEGRPSDPVLASNLLRKSYAAFYGNITRKVSDETLNEKAEGIYFATVKDPEGVLYTTVSVGFGGGNQAVYYYAAGTLKLAPFFSYDGDCRAAGEVAELPIEEDIQDVQTSVIRCEVSSKKAPFSRIDIRLQTLNGVLISDNAVLKLTPSQSADAVSQKTLTTSGINYFSGSQRYGKYVAVTGLLEAVSGKKISFNLSANERKASTLSGRVYSDVTGGYWDKEAYDIETSVKCGGLEAIKEAKYSRVIRFK